MPRLSLALILTLAAAPLAAQDLPPAVAAFAAERAAACAVAGGAARVGPAFATRVDLNGDGAADHIVDLAGVECANAWSAFCGETGCPLSVWITRAGGDATREWEDVVEGWRFDPSGGEPALIVERAAAACPGAAPCEERLVFALPPAAEEPEPPTAAEPPAPEPRTLPDAALAASGAAGWTLRRLPDGGEVAVSDGPGAIATLALFCLQNAPFLAARLDAPPAAETAELAFAFSAQEVAAAARPEPGAGGALVVALEGGPLAGLLAGRDTEARVSLDGAAQGALSLRGSTRAIRGALAPCAEM